MDNMFQVHDIGNNSKTSSLLQKNLYDDKKNKISWNFENLHKNILLQTFYLHFKVMAWSLNLSTS
jgi:hypothetical protein